MRAGVLPPATPPVQRRSRCLRCSFNEGRGLTPGDARAAGLAVGQLAHRSMRAGVLPPATPEDPPWRPPQMTSFNEGRGLTPGDASGSAIEPKYRHVRSMRAGVLPPATPAAGPWLGRRWPRSMRAGVLPPATPHARSLHRPRRSPFNEGRGLTPGDASETRDARLGGFRTVQ